MDKKSGDQLKSLRVAVGLTQTEVAKKLKYTTPQFVSNWERGLSMIPYSAIKTVAKLYKVTDIKLFNIVWESNKEAAFLKAIEDAGLDL